MNTVLFSNVKKAKIIVSCHCQVYIPRLVQFIIMKRMKISLVIENLTLWEAMFLGRLIKFIK